MPSFLPAMQHKSLTGWPALGLLVAALGCSVSAVDSRSSATTVNECDDDNDCKGGLCVESRCQAKQGFFSTLLLEVSPPATGDPNFAGVSYLHRLEVDIKGGRVDMMLAPPVQVTGAVGFEPYPLGDGDETCTLAFMGDEPTTAVLAAPEGIPASVTFTPSARILGVPSTRYDAAVDFGPYQDVEPRPAPPLSFALKLPAGEYDIYVRPRPAAEGGCRIPPTLFRRYQVQQSGDLSLRLPLPPPASFRLDIRWPKGAGQPSLEGWKVDMLDPLTGLVISTESVLGSPLDGDSHAEYRADVLYSPVTLAEADSELVRLSPPKGLDAPTIVLARSVLELFSPGSGVIDQFLGYPQPVTIEGQLMVSGLAEPTAGSITAVSTSIEGIGEGVFASYVRSAEAGPDGKFTISLLPGTYRVHASPASSGMTTAAGAPAASQTEWEVASEPAVQAGKTVELLPAVHVTGIANVLQGEPAAGAAVIALASPRDIQVDLLTLAAQGNLSIAPAAQSGVVDAEGFFDVQADPGVFDLSIRPPDGSGFAWYVASQLVVQPATSPALLVQNIGSPILPLPVPYTGRVAVPLDEDKSAPIAEALLRAYVYLDQNNAYTGDPTRAVSVVQVGETRADGDGNFELLIPANLN